jgi:hypothetical protein
VVRSRHPRTAERANSGAAGEIPGKNPQVRELPARQWSGRSGGDDFDYPGDLSMLSPIGRGVSRVLTLALSLAVGLGLAATAAEAARPLKPGVPTDLKIGVTYVGGSYVLPLAWKAGANTTSFLGTVTGGGVTLASAKLSTTSWSPSVSAKAGTTVTAQIVAVNGKFKSAAATASITLPDVSPPVGAYAATWGDPVGGNVTVTFQQSSLADDVSASAGVQVAVDFGDGQTMPTTGTQTTFTHSYPFPTSGAKRYEPRITLTDAAGNSAYAGVNAIVLNDHTAPVGVARVLTASGWAGWTSVQLTTSATDDVSPTARIRRTVVWGDGASTTAYGDQVLRHVYASAGTFRPSVTFADEALPANSSNQAAGSAVISKDIYRPTVTLTLPRARRSSVRSWKVLRGTAADGQTAVRSVRVKAVEKRGAAYYAYVPATGAWVRAGRKARAIAKAGYVQVATSGPWSVRLPKLTKGVLLYRVEAVDALGNVSAVAKHRQRLTRR